MGRLPSCATEEEEEECEEAEEEKPAGAPCVAEPKEAKTPGDEWPAPGLGVSSGCVFANKKSCAFGRKGDLFVCTGETGGVPVGERR